jgi:hypothetical protein
VEEYKVHKIFAEREVTFEEANKKKSLVQTELLSAVRTRKLQH